MTKPQIEVKGIRDGLLVILGDGEWLQLREALLFHVDGQQEFMQGARMAVDVGNHILKAVDLGLLRDELSERGVTLWAVISNSATTEKTAQTLGLATVISQPRRAQEIKPLDTRYNYGDEAVFIQRTLRSGYNLTCPGHVIVLGDVNPGAEIIAGGNIIVWGRLRGLVHAGAEGDESALICSLDLMPTQLRIAGHIAITPKRRGKPQPEIAYVKNNQVVAEIWGKS